MKQLPIEMVLPGFLLISLCCATACASGPDASGFSLDALERQLELGRQEQLYAQRVDTENALAPFTTDGCSGGLSVGWEYLADRTESFREVHGARPPWEACCIVHDRAYHIGGSRKSNAVESFEARMEADKALRTCVLEIGEIRSHELGTEYGFTAKEVDALYTAIADLMYRAVRIGGIPCTGLPWRWGYGWPQCE